jgi:hypothetical protein
LAKSQRLSNLPNAPAFSAYNSSATSLANGTFTKIALQTEEFDTASAFDSTTNYRFTPQVAGYYQISGLMSLASAAANTIASIYKNGSEFKRGSVSGSASDSGQAAPVSALIYLNGSTDYVELYGYQITGGSVNTTTGAAYTYFQGVLVRPAA